MAPGWVGEQNLAWAGRLDDQLWFGGLRLRQSVQQGRNLLRQLLLRRGSTRHLAAQGLRLQAVAVVVWTGGPVLSLAAGLPACWVW